MEKMLSVKSEIHMVKDLTVSCRQGEHDCNSEQNEKTYLCQDLINTNEPNRSQM